MHRLAVLPVIALVLSACASSETILSADPTAAAVSSDIGQTFDLRPGQTARVGSEGLIVGFREVKADSRCPIDVQCVWAGDAEVQLQVTVGKMAWTAMALHTGLEPRSGTFRNWRITLVELKPAPRSNTRIPQENYVATLRVE